MTNFLAINAAHINALSGAELLALYNEAAAALNATPCKRFSTLANGQARTLKLVEALCVEVKARAAAKTVPAPAKVKVNKAKPAPVRTDACPGCGADCDITPAGLEGTAAAERNFCHSCSTQWNPETGKVYTAPKANHEGRSKAIAASWADAEVARKRAERHSVVVTGGTLKGSQEFGSVSKAFIALGLPMSKHIKFRGQLKAAGKLAFEAYNFAVVEK